MEKEMSKLLKQRNEYRKWKKDVTKFTIDLDEFCDNAIKNTTLEHNHVKNILLDEVDRLEINK